MLKNGIKEYLHSLGFNDTAILYLIACRLDLDYTINDETFINLIRHNIIERDYINEKIIVKIPLFEEEEENTTYVFDKNANKNLLNKVEDATKRIDEYRSKFKGIRTKSIGDKKQCIESISKWLFKNPEYTFDDVIEATEYYISNTDHQYVSNADNFIFNYDTKGNLISSLSIVMETIKMGTLEKKFN